jgi:asparagine synthase (glutamine-hydrolysing)
MCGIAGILDPGRSTSSDDLARCAGAMASALAHRGPDDHGLWVDAEVGLAFGHRRLSVVGLGPTGHQPMVSDSGRWVVNYNGEIYNFTALRRRLASTGVVQRGDSDTEVIVQGIECWGLDATVDACEGMFAMAVWDRDRRELHLLRDRLGEKPLYYGWVDRHFVFASELKALHRLPAFAPELDRGAVALFLRHNCVPAPHTIYRGIAKLEPGQMVTLDAGARHGSSPRSRIYWSARHAVESARSRPLAGTDDELADRVEATLGDAVRDRMLADVPVGAFLSGGVDSSLVVALMQRHSTRPVRTFTIGFAEKSFDESAEASAVARHLGTEHTAVRVSDQDALDVIPHLADIWDEPFSDSSQIPTFLVSRLARSEVTVSLSGDGGDELFAGYNRHAWLERLWRRAGSVPAPLRQAVGAAMGRLPPGAVEHAARIGAAVPGPWRARNPATKFAKVGKILAADDVADAYLALVSHWEDAATVVRRAPALASLAAHPEQWPRLGGVTEQLLWLDLIGYLPDDILTKVDRGAMAVSLETRVPFLDRDVVDLAWRLPMAVKLRGTTTKWILRRVLHRHVPPALVERPKMGFGLPVGEWLRGALRPWAEELLGPSRLRAQGVLDAEPIRRAWEAHVSGRRDLGYELWDVLVLQAWLDRWVPSLAGPR